MQAEAEGIVALHDDFCDQRTAQLCVWVVEEVRPILQQGYQLLRPLELLPTDGRPLSQGADLAAMWAERAPLYERFRDAAIDNSGTVGQTAQAIWRDFCENSGH